MSIYYYFVFKNFEVKMCEYFQVNKINQGPILVGMESRLAEIMEDD